MTKQERAVGILLVILGLAVAYYSYTALKLGTINQPGPGLFPFISGVGITLFCAVWIIANRDCVISTERLWEPGQWVRPAIAVAVTGGYAALMEPVGYLPSTILFLVVWQILIEREKWKKIVIIAGAGTLTMYVLFVFLLKVALP